LLRFAILHDVMVAAAFGMTSLSAQIFFPAQAITAAERVSHPKLDGARLEQQRAVLGMALGSLAGGQIMASGGFAAIPPISAIVTIAGWVVFTVWRRQSANPLPA